MNILITGTSGGIGSAAAKKFIVEGHKVFGIDKKEPIIQSDSYQHFVLNLNEPETYPKLENIEVVVNNAGSQNLNGKHDDIDNNLKTLVNVTKKYILKNENIKSVVNLASVSAHNGSEFGEYCASKGGVLSYTK